MNNVNIIDALDRMSIGLDFANETHRQTFFLKVYDTFANAKLSIIRGYVRELNWEWCERTGEAPKGPVRVGQSRVDALRHLASDFILARQLGEL